MCAHGESQWNVEDKICGQTDIPLTERATPRQKRPGDGSWKRESQRAEILCSPLLRAKDTAAHISQVTGIPLKVEPRLTEQNFGIWEGTSPRISEPFCQAKKEFLSRYETGESMFQLAQRIYNLLDELKETGQDYILVAHNGISRVVCSYFREMTNEEYASYGVENCSVTEFTYE